eukprot:m.45908 g.45908  ORF g.45908 m.45908 type:complete len:439 (+) comp11813_c0_seq1:123-1439(+)
MPSVRVVGIAFSLAMVSIVALAVRDQLLTQHIIELICDTQFPAGTRCDDKHVVEHADPYVTYGMVGYGLSSFLTINAVSVFADRYGKRWPVLFVLCGLSLDCIVISQITNVKLMLVGHCLSGLFGSLNSLFPLVYAMVADASTRRTRTSDFAIVEAATFTGTATGPYLGGLAIKTMGTTNGFLTGFGILAVTAVTFGLVYKEAPKQIDVDDDDNDDRDPAPLTLETLSPAHILKTWFRPGWRFITFTLFLEWVASRGMTLCINLFAKQAFDWGSYDLGLLFSLHGLFGVLTNTVFIRIFLRMRLDDCDIIVVALIAFTTASLDLALGTENPSLFVTAMVLKGTSAFLTPTLRTMVSKSASRAEMATVLGALASLENLVAALAGLGFGPLYDVFDHAGSPSSVFYVAAALTVIPMPFFLRPPKGFRERYLALPVMPLYD